MVTLGQKIGLLKGLLHGEVAPSGPFMVTADVTSRCNLQCLGCRSHSSYAPFPAENAPDISLPFMEKLCDDLRRRQSSYLILTGDGEPMLHPRIFDIVTMGKRAGCHVILFTNGTLLTQANAVSLRECGLDVLRVSLWASSIPECQENYPGTPPGLFTTVTEGLRRVAASKNGRPPRLILHQPLNRHNMRGLLDFMELAAGTGCDGVSFSPMRTWGGAPLKEFIIGDEDLPRLRDELRKARRWLDERGLSHNIEEVLKRFEVGENVWAAVPCYIAWLHLRVRLDGTVQACLTCDRNLGNLRHQTLGDIWNGEPMRRLRRELRRNSKTALADNCDCGYCCYLAANQRVHKYYRWLAPIANLGDCR
ncbi:MAG: radical SAM protein [Acidobacteriales bacterium]|nr:radical SAM protein [Terriglobales bacterium]